MYKQQEILTFMLIDCTVSNGLYHIRNFSRSPETITKQSPIIATFVCLLAFLELFKITSTLFSIFSTLSYLQPLFFGLF